MSTPTFDTDALRQLADAFLTPRIDAAALRALALPGAQAFRLPTAWGQLAGQRVGTGRPVLLVHGWEGQASDLQSFADALRSQGRAVLAIDLPAHGASDGPMTSIPWSAEALLALDAAHGPFEAVVAHSVGAAVVSEALAGGLRAERAVLLAAPSRYIDYAQRFAQAFGLDTAASEALLDELARRGVDVRRIAMARSAPRLGALPALFVHARDDRVVPFTDAEANHAVWPGARLIALQRGGHRRLLGEPAVVQAVLEFLGVRSPAPGLHATMAEPAVAG